MGSIAVDQDARGSVQEGEKVLWGSETKFCRTVRAPSFLT